jgi:hypothetical protein
MDWKEFVRRGDAAKARRAASKQAGNERLKELAVQSASYLLEKLNDWTTEDINHAIRRFEHGPAFDQGIAQFLRLYLTARTIGSVTKTFTPPTARRK